LTTGNKTPITIDTLMRKGYFCIYLRDINHW